MHRSVMLDGSPDQKKCLLEVALSESEHFLHLGTKNYQDVVMCTLVDFNTHVI